MSVMELRDVSSQTGRRLVSVAVLALALSTLAPPAAGETLTTRAEDRPRLLWIPGASRAISFALSASRDVGAVAIQLSPYLSASAGGDLALWGVQFPEMTLRFGFFGLIELEGSDPLRPGSDGFASLFPAEAVILWRGQYGVSLSLSLDDVARRSLPLGGALEASLSFRHESGHFTGSAEEDGARWSDVSDVGEFVMYDVSALLPVGRFEVALRGQVKLFIPKRGRSSYTYGPGVDVIARWRLHDRVNPFASLFFEYLFGGERMAFRDNYLLRMLLGALLPSRGADFQIYLSLALGHGKGLLVTREALLFGAGLRIAWPPSMPRFRCRARQRDR